jgi:hypothetical protein
VTDNAGGSVTKQFSITIYPKLVNKTKSLKKAVVGQSYSATLKASGGQLPYTWSIVGGSLPAGLSPNSSGTITGMPGGNAPATYNPVFRVTDALGNFDDVPLSLLIQ